MGSMMSRPSFKSAAIVALLASIMVLKPAAALSVALPVLKAVATSVVGLPLGAVLMLQRVSDSVGGTY
jgi:hypothetical protein